MGRQASHGLHEHALPYCAGAAGIFAKSVVTDSASVQAGSAAGDLDSLGGRRANHPLQVVVAVGRLLAGDGGGDRVTHHEDANLLPFTDREGTGWRAMGPRAGRWQAREGRRAPDRSPEPRAGPEAVCRSADAEATSRSLTSRLYGPPFTDNKLITESWGRVGMCGDDRGSQVADS